MPLVQWAPSFAALRIIERKKARGFKHYVTIRYILAFEKIHHKGLHIRGWQRFMKAVLNDNVSGTRKSPAHPLRFHGWRIRVQRSAQEQSQHGAVQGCKILWSKGEVSQRFLAHLRLHINSADVAEQRSASLALCLQ